MSMMNGYFKLVSLPQGFGIQLFAAKEGGEMVRVLEVMNYLEPLSLEYNIQDLKRLIESNQDAVFPLGEGLCPVRNEEYVMEISQDAMLVKVRFFPPSSTGKRMPLKEFLGDLTARNITWGIQHEFLEKLFKSQGVYCRDLVVAVGKNPRHGTDARVEYFFNTDMHIQPTMREDGSVDYFNLNVINHVNKGDLLAKIIPADEGEPGMNVYGNILKPRDVKKLTLKFGNNILLSEDRMSIYSQVDGHVTLVEDRVFVSDVYQIENCDLSTGNVDFQGSVQINGNVANNMTVKAKGNVIINGVVEGAHIEAGGNIVIARGMNGMSKGYLKAGGNIISKFVENATLEAEGYVNTESILHSRVVAGTDITVTGRKGFITGGHVQAANTVTVKNLGSDMGASTIVEVGVRPQLKAEYVELQKKASEIVKEIKNCQPIIQNFTERRSKGAKFSPDQINYVKKTAATLEQKKGELTLVSEKMKALQELLQSQGVAAVIVQGVVCPGTTIVIGDVSMNVQNSYSYCKFEKKEGNVKILPL